MKNCLPIMAENFREVYSIVESYNDNPKIHMFEIRVDSFLDDLDYDELYQGWKDIKGISQKPLIFTYRTKFEGGLGESSVSEYNEIMRWVIKELRPEYLDLELSSCCSDANAKMHIRLAKQQGIKIILSKHYMIYTGSQNEIEKMFMRMHYLGCDIPKIATMANGEEDVENLVNGGEKAKQQIGDLIAIAMGLMGKKTRLPGEFNKSCIGFIKAIGKKAESMNDKVDLGQLDLDELI